MTDADGLKAKVDAFLQKGDEYRQATLALMNTIEDMKDMVLDLGLEAPYVTPTLATAKDNIRTSNWHIGQVTELISEWRKKL